MNIYLYTRINGDERIQATGFNYCREQFESGEFYECWEVDLEEVNLAEFHAIMAGRYGRDWLGGFHAYTPEEDVVVYSKFTQK